MGLEDVHNTMKKSHLFRALAACSLSAVLLAGCGGGGGGGAPAAPTPPPSERFGASSQFENICTLETQKRFIRSYLDEVYLWYNEIPEVDASRYNTVEDYFNALLVKTPDANGVPKDRFSTVIRTAAAQNLQQQSFAQPQADATQLLANHTDAVPVTKVVTSPGGRRTGYIQFNDHESGAQDDLITAFQQIRDAGVQDLVLDLRFNGGGFLYIADTAASMIAGPASEGKTFEMLRYNDKRGAETAASNLIFSSRVQFTESQYTAGTPLPQLNLPRVFVLTSSGTCSASESLMNGLRGIDVQVIRVGATTCGKPYGFRQKNNCGYAYFPIEFQGVNAKGFGDYTAGFTPTCQVQDNRGVAAGSSLDPLLNGALYYIDNGACPAGSATGVQSAAAPLLAPEPRAGRPAWAGRLLTTP
jgi:hypothetical protein